MAFFEPPFDNFYTSTVCFAEMRFGVVISPDAVLRAVLLHWLFDEIRPMFRGRVLDISESVLLRWRLLIEQGRKTGRTYSQPDLLLAATALEDDLVLLTRNTRDFSGLGLALHNHWVA